MEDVKQNEVSTTEVEEMIEAPLETVETEATQCATEDVTEEELEDLGGSTETEPMFEMGDSFDAELEGTNSAIQELIDGDGENLVVTHSVFDDKGNLYICGIDKNAGPIVMKKPHAESTEQSFISPIAGIVDIKSMMLDHSRIDGQSVIVIVGMSPEEHVVFIVLSTELDVIFHKTTEQNFVVNAITKWKSQYIVGTGIRHELDENSSHHAIMILDEEFGNEQVMVFGDGNAAEISGMSGIISSSITDLRIIDDKLYVGSVFFNGEKMISNIACVDNEFKVVASTIISIDGAKITRFGMIVPTINGLTIIGVYSFNGEETERFSMNLNKDLTKYENPEMVIGIDQSNSIN